MLPSNRGMSILGNLTPVELVTDEGTVTVEVDNSFWILTEQSYIRLQLLQWKRCGQPNWHSFPHKWSFSDSQLSDWLLSLGLEMVPLCAVMFLDTWKIRIAVGCKTVECQLTGRLQYHIDDSAKSSCCMFYVSGTVVLMLFCVSTNLVHILAKF